MMMLLISVLIFSAATFTQAGGVGVGSGSAAMDNGITIHTEITVSADMVEENRTMLLAGLDQWLSLRWRVNESGWFPVWELVLNVAGAETRLATAVPTPNHSYETILSYNTGNGTVGVEVHDTTEKKALVAGGTQTSAARSVANPTTDGRLLAVSGRYEPIGVVWDIGTDEGGSFLTGVILEPDTKTTVKIAPPGPISGEYRLKVERDGVQELLASVPADRTEIFADLPTTNLPLGRSTIVLDYVGDTLQREIGRRQVVVGKVDAVIGAFEADYNQQKLHTEIVLKSDSRLTGVAMTLQARLVNTQWNAAAGAYVDGKTLTYDIPLVADGTLVRGEQRVPVDMPIPDENGLWRAEFNLTTHPDFSLSLVTQNAYFTVGAGHAKLADGRSVIRIGTYNILGFQGYPAEPAEQQLGGKYDPRRIEHFSNVIRSLNADILCLQEGASTYQMADYASRLGYNLAPFASTTAYPGGILTRFPILESHSFPVRSWSGVIPYSRYGGAALLDVGGVLLWVVSLHAYPHDEAVRIQEAAILGAEVEKLLQVSPYVVVGGDFNERIPGSLHQALKSRGFLNVLEVTGGVQPIDHLYVSPSLAGLIRGGQVVNGAGFRLGATGTGAWANSDHVPVLMELALP